MEIIPSFQNLLKTGFRFTGKNFANLFSRIGFFKPKLAPEKHLIIGTYGNPEIGKMLLEKNFIFGNVRLDVETDTPWAIKPFSQEVERAINGLEWLNDLSAINGQDAREIAALWIDKLPYKKIRNDIMSATYRLRSTSKNFLFLKTALNNEIEKKLYNIIKTDFLFIKILKPFIPDLFERLHITNSLIISSYIFDITENKKLHFAKSMYRDLKKYELKVEKGLIRNPQEILDIYLMAIESQTILSELKSNKIKENISLQRKTTDKLGAVIRFLQLNNGDLISAHGGSVGRYQDFIINAPINKNRGLAERKNFMGFEKLEGGRISILIDSALPVYGKNIRNAHAGFSSFELSFGKEPIFVNCGGGSRFGREYRQYCQRSKAHNILIVNNKSQCSFAKKLFWNKSSDYYIKSGPKNISIEKNKTLTTNSIELVHDAYTKDYGIIVGRKISIDLSGKMVQGVDYIETEDEKFKEQSQEYNLSVHFHLHPKTKFQKKENELLIDLQSGHTLSFKTEGANLNLEDSTHIDNFYEPHRTKKIILENLFKNCNGKINWYLTVLS